MRLRTVPVVVLVLLGNLMLGGAAQGSGADPWAGAIPVPPESPSAVVAPVVSPALAPVGRPNFVLFNADDLSEDQVALMPNLRAMLRQGWNAQNFLVNNSLCCPSRTSTLTGRYSHNTGIYANDGPNGGYAGTVRLGVDKDTLATDLSRAGYRTGMFGKYLNGYRDAQLTQVPPGWTTWQAASNPYTGHDFRLSNDGRPVDYVGRRYFQPDVITRLGTDFVDDSLAARRPFFLYLAPGLPHAPSAHTAADAAAHADVVPTWPASFGRRMLAAPQWLAEVPPFRPGSRDRMLREYRLRLWSALTVDRMLGRLRAHLAAKGVTNVYVIFTSDNGFHLGQHMLRPGKQTPYEYDIQVPLVVTGPGVAPGAQYAPLLQNVDLRPTVLDLAGLPAARTDGVSFRSVLDGEGFAGRTVALLEHTQTAFLGDDRQGKAAALIPDYVAVRTPDALYVEYVKGRNRFGFHDLRTDPDQLRNSYGALTAAERRWWAGVAARLDACRGRACSRLPAAQPG